MVELGLKYVQQVKGNWIGRITVPEELRKIIGQRELVERDLPSDKRTRERLAHGIIDRFIAKIEKAREILAANKDAPSFVLSSAAKAHYAKRLLADDQKRASLPTMAQMTAEYNRVMERLDRGEIGIGSGPSVMFNATTDYELMLSARDHYINNRKRRLNALRLSAKTGETRWIADAVNQYVFDNKLEILEGSPEWYELANALTLPSTQALHLSTMTTV